MEWTAIIGFILGGLSTFLFGNRLTDFLASKITKQPDRVTSIRLSNLETKLDRVTRIVDSSFSGDLPKVQDVKNEIERLKITFNSYQDHINKIVLPLQSREK